MQNRQKSSQTPWPAIYMMLSHDFSLHLRLARGALPSWRLTRQRGLPPAHRATTVELRTLYPFVIPDDLGVDGCYIGREASGRSFCFDPWECYAKGKLTSPNIVVLGQIGRGKSAFVKSFIWRQRIFGRQCWVLDPKGEYEALARACGGSHLRLGPGLGLRLNPLDVSPAADRPRRRGGRDHSRWGRSRPTSAGPNYWGRCWPVPWAAPAARGASRGRRRSWVPPKSTHRGTDPAAGGRRAARTRNRTTLELLGTDTEGLRQDGRQVALELRRLVHGDLAGMFDGETSPGVDLGAGMVVLDLSRLYASPALGLLMVCALSWLQSALAGRLGQAPRRPGRGLGRPEPPGHRPLAAGHVQAVAGLRGGQRGRRAPSFGPESGRPGRLPGAATGRGAAGRRRDPGGVRPGPGGGGAGRRTPRPVPDRTVCS